MNGIERIAAERQRQIDDKCWSPEHDDDHEDGEMALAAASYILAEQDRNEDYESSDMWPWEAKWWKPSQENRIRELEKAGALIAAEIDRLIRKPDRDQEFEEYLEKRRRANREQ